MFRTLEFIHLLSVVCYFCAIFTLDQIFLYYKRTDQYSEVKKKIHRKRYVFMSERIWNIIIVPGSLIMLGTGLMMICLRPELLEKHSFELKLILLTALCLYHFWCREQILHLKNLYGTALTTSSVKLRRANELITGLVFLFGCTGIVKYSSLISGWQIITVIFIFLFFLLTALICINR